MKGKKKDILVTILMWKIKNTKNKMLKLDIKVMDTYLISTKTSLLLLVPEGEEDHVTGAHNNVSGGPANAGVTQAKKRRFYKDDEKLAIYAKLLSRTDPPVLHQGVSRAVAQKFGVPVRTVQNIWHKGQAGVYKL
ncbi:hypothetical protein EJB05_05450, partial [Eragrostis curvula]